MRPIEIACDQRGGLARLPVPMRRLSFLFPAALLLCSVAARPALAGGIGGGDKEGKHLTAIMGTQTNPDGDLLVFVDAERHTIAVYATSKKGITPIAFRDYRYDLMIKEYPAEKYGTKKGEGFSSWEIKALWEKTRKEELEKKGEWPKDDKDKQKKLLDIKDKVKSGVGKTLLYVINTTGTRDACEEHLVLMDMGSTEDGGITILDYAVEFKGESSGAIVPKGIRTITEDFGLLQFKLKSSSPYSYRGDFRNGNRQHLTVKELEKALEKMQESEEEDGKRK